MIAVISFAPNNPWIFFSHISRTSCRGPRGGSGMTFLCLNTSEKEVFLMGILTRRILQNSWKKNLRNDTARKASQSPPENVGSARDLAYINDGDQMHLVDIFYPEDTQGKLPVIIDVHGGGWMYGDKELNEYFCMNLAVMGFAVADMSYRLLPATDLRGQIQDVFACIHWLHNNGGAYHCDFDNVLLTGDSAGGHLVSLAAAINEDEALCQLYGVRKLPFKPAGVVINHGVYDLRAKIVTSEPVMREMERLWFGRRPKENPIYERSGLPGTADSKTYPPVLVITSAADGLFPHSEALMRYLDKNGFEYELCAPDPGAQGAEKLGHVFNVLHPEWKESAAVNRDIAEFFRKRVK